MSEISKLKDEEIDALLAEKGEQSIQGRALAREKKKREESKTFWRKDIVPWFALLVAIASLAWNITLNLRVSRIESKITVGTSTTAVATNGDSSATMQLQMPNTSSQGMPRATQ